jgi:hypothetical protein
LWQAVVAQPYKRGARVAAPGRIDSSIGEFWVENPWDITSAGHNLSNNERQRFYLNLRGQGFLDLSYLSGADAEGDGRSVLAGDLRNDGRLDLIVRKVGGGTKVGDKYTGGVLTIYENQFPRRHYLEVSLRGRQSNRLGIGARLTASAKGLSLLREMYPINSFRSQGPTRVHFGLGDATVVDKLTIHWPSGQVQVLANVPADRRIVVEEGKQGNEAVETVVPGTTIRP